MDFTSEQQLEKLFLWEYFGNKQATSEWMYVSETAIVDLYSLTNDDFLGFLGKAQL